jgi:hypothetical protein
MVSTSIWATSRAARSSKHYWYTSHEAQRANQTTASEPRCTSTHDHYPDTPILGTQRQTLTYHQHGNQLQGRRDPRRRQQNHDRRIHRKQSDGQAHKSARHHLVLQIRLGGRHTSSGRHRAISPRHVRYHKRRSAHHPDRSRHLPGAVLRQQGRSQVRHHIQQFTLQEREEYRRTNN